jgi:tetratricopeptide (TPR) repeat protein
MSVAWITELKNVLSGFFFLAALLAWVRFCGVSQRTDRKWSYGLVIGLYVSALLSKTSTSILPVAMLLILWWKQGRIARKEFLPVVPSFILGILFGGFTLWLEKYAKGAVGREFTLSFLERLLVSGRSFWFSLVKLVWPARLTFIYPRWQIDPANAWPYLFPTGVIMLLGVLWWARQRIGRAPFAAMLYFWLAFPALVMVQVLFMMRYTFVADHWQYLGSMSVIPLTVGGTTVAFDRWQKLRRAGPASGTVVLGVLSLLTWRQAHIYHDVETLWRDTLAKNPSADTAHNNLGCILAEQQKYEAAAAHFLAALESNPRNAPAHGNLAKALAMRRSISWI